MVRCKDFEYKAVYAGKRIQGHENDWVYEVYYKGHNFNFGHKFYTKKAAQAWVSAVVRNYKKERRMYEQSSV